MKDELTSQQVALQMLQMQVCLVAVRALVFALGVFGRVRDGFANGGAGTARMGGQHTATTLLADDVHRLGVLVREDGRVRVKCRMTHAHATSAYVLQTSGEGVLAQRVRVRA